MPEALDGLVDFIGYPIGFSLNAVVVDPGIVGLLDFVGYPTSVPVLSPAVVSNPAFIGLLDFVGYPVETAGITTQQTGKGKGYFGRILNQYIYAQEMQRSILQDQKSNFQQQEVVALVNRVAEQWHDFQTDLAKARDNAIFATLLAEV